MKSDILDKSIALWVPFVPLWVILRSLEGKIPGIKMEKQKNPLQLIIKDA